MRCAFNLENGITCMLDAGEGKKAAILCQAISLLLTSAGLAITQGEWCCLPPAEQKTETYTALNVSSMVLSLVAMLFQVALTVQMYGNYLEFSML